MRNVYGEWSREPFIQITCDFLSATSTTRGKGFRLISDRTSYLTIELLECLKQSKNTHVYKGICTYCLWMKAVWYARFPTAVLTEEDKKVRLFDTPESSSPTCLVDFIQSIQAIRSVTISEHSCIASVDQTRLQI